MFKAEADMENLELTGHNEEELDKAMDQDVFNAQQIKNLRQSTAVKHPHTAPQGITMQSGSEVTVFQKRKTKKITDF